MKPFHVAVITKNSAVNFLREGRNSGYWSYPVPEFSWDHVVLGKHGWTCDLENMKQKGYDLILHEDGGNWGTYTNKGALPLVFFSVDDTLSPQHHKDRRTIAAQADLVLLDHSPTHNFADLDRPTRRLNYCVNDQVFCPVPEKTFDVAFHCAAGARQGEPGAKERIRVRQLLHSICGRHGWSYRSGVLGLPDYARSLAEARVVVNVPRTDTNRPWRVFDTMACRSCLLTAPVPHVKGDGIREGEHYVTFHDDRQLEKLLEYLLDDGGGLEEIAASAYNHVMANHTWAIRAAQFRTTLAEVFGL